MRVTWDVSGHAAAGTRGQRQTWVFIGSCRAGADTEQRQLATGAGFNMSFPKKILANAAVTEVSAGVVTL